MRNSVYATVAFLTLGLSACKGGPESTTMHGNISLSGEVVYRGEFSDRTISQATVQIESNGKVVGQVITDESGSFIFDQLPGGEFDLIVEKGDQYAVYRYSVQYSGGLLDASKFPPQGYSVRVEMKFYSTVLSGQVVEAGTQMPIVGATISTNPQTVQVESDPEGYYHLESDQFEDEIRYAIQVKHSEYQLFFEPDHVENFQLAQKNDVPQIQLIRHEQDDLIKPDSIHYGNGGGKVVPGN